MQVIIIEGIATSGKSTLIKLLQGSNFKGRKVIVFPEEQTHEPIMKDTSNLNLQFFKSLISKIDKNSEIIIFERFYLTQAFRANVEMSAYAEIEQTLLSYTPMTIFLKVDDHAIAERVSRAAEHRRDSWGDHIKTKGKTPEEIAAYYIDQQQNLLKLLEQSKLPHHIFNTTNHEYENIAAEIEELVRQKSSNILLISNFSDVADWVIKYLHKNDVKNIAFIMDAKKPRLERDQSYVFTDKLRFEAEGFKVKLVDLEAAGKVETRETFSGVDAIYVKGGNSFYLLNAMRESGFSEIAEELVGKGILYIGESAGAYVACPTIEMAHWKHQDQDSLGLKDLTGLSLVPFLITAHYKGELEVALKPHIDASRYEVLRLRDNQLILVSGDKKQVIDV